MAAIAIDGPAGAGKSTVARRVAEALGFTYLDTGAMYRAVALSALESGVDPSDPGGVEAIAQGVEIEVDDGSVRVDGRDVSALIRTGDVTRASAEVARHPALREHLVQLQRRAASERDVVMEGRDIGSKVLPDADVKVFLTASLDERARRRADQIGARADRIEELKADIRDRDETDSTRDVSPLVQPADAVAVDTTGKTIDEVVSEVVALARSKLR